MAQQGIREYDAKRMLARNMAEYFGGNFGYTGKVALVDNKTDWATLTNENPWLKTEKLVAKPDQLFGKRGKLGLLFVNKNLDEIKKWVQERMDKETTIGKVSGKLTHFLVEPFVPHQNEYYLAIKSTVTGDDIYFSTKGGMDIESVWDTVTTIPVAVDEDIETVDIRSKLKDDIPGDKVETIAKYIKGLYKYYSALHFAYLEINPFAMDGNNVYPLDMVAKIDNTADYECASKWGNIPFPAPFGRLLTKEEAYVKELDSKTGASLKLTVLNENARLWTLVAGGGASVIYTDTIVDLGFAGDLANYGEYSGDPNKELTYEYTKTILSLLTKTKNPKGKVLLVGGGIANFTDVAKTFAGIIQAVTEYKDKLKEGNVKIYVRRGGPNYKEGLRLMREMGEKLGIPIDVYGPEMHMTKIVSMGLR